MISYASNHEDVLLDRLFCDQPSGFFVDVGAHDPVWGSASKHFSDLGWRGMNLEPIPRLFAAFTRLRPRDINLQVAASNKDGEVDVFEVADEPSLSTFCAEQAEAYRKSGRRLNVHHVATRTLATLIQEHGCPTVDFVKIDVEGAEREVLAGANLPKWRPRAVVVEAVVPGTGVPSHQAWEHLLLDAGYRFGAFDGLNRYYLREEDAGLLPRWQTPVNVFDRFVPHRQRALEERLARYESSGLARAAIWCSEVPSRARRRMRRWLTEAFAQGALK